MWVSTRAAEPNPAVEAPEDAEVDAEALASPLRRCRWLVLVLAAELAAAAIADVEEEPVEEPLMDAVGGTPPLRAKELLRAPWRERLLRRLGVGAALVSRERLLVRAATTGDGVAANVTLRKDAVPAAGCLFSAPLEEVEVALALLSARARRVPTGLA